MRRSRRTACCATFSTSATLFDFMPQQFGSFVASELYCPKCRRAQPVRERLLLVLPSGDLYEYTCSQCQTALGKRTVSGGRIPPPQGASAVRKKKRSPIQLG